jgi:hypothetical protein
MLWRGLIYHAVNSGGSFATPKWQPATGWQTKLSLGLLQTKVVMPQGVKRESDPGQRRPFSRKKLPAVGSEDGRDSYLQIAKNYNLQTMKVIRSCCGIGS